MELESAADHRTRRAPLRGGSLIVPEFNARPRLAKPIYFYWLIAGAAWLGSVAGIDSVAAMRIVPVLMGGFVVLGTYRLGVRLFGLRRGLLAAGMLMSLLEFQRLAQELVVDVTLAALVLWAWVFFVEATERIARRERTALPLLGFYVVLGLACLTKGPFMVALFVVLPALVYLRLTRQLSQLREAGLIWGVPLALAIDGSWFLAVFVKGQDTLSFFVRENLQRMMGQADHLHYVPFAFYLEVIWENLFPWSLLIPFAVVQSSRFCRSGQHFSNGTKLVACASLVPFAILGLAVSKRSLYLVSLYPFIALALAGTVERMLKTAETELKPAVWILVVGWLLACGVNCFCFAERSRQPGVEAFYRAVRDCVGDRPLVMFGESENEAVWYLDRSTPVDRLSRVELSTRFFRREDTLLLVSEKILAREPELRRSIVTLATLQRGGRKFLIGRPDANAPPDPALFAPRVTAAVTR